MRWTYVNKLAKPAGGIFKAVVIDASSRSPGLMKFAIKGRSATYRALAIDLSLSGEIVLDPAGACGVATFPGPAPAPACVFKPGPSTSTLLCK